MMKSAEEDKYGFAPNVCLAPQYLSLQSSPAISREASLAPAASAAYYPALLDGTPALESPRIEITAYGQFPNDDDDGAADDEAERDGLPATAKRLNSVVTLTLPGVGGVGEAYRDPSCLSPASSVSSRSCQSEASSYESGFSYNYEPSPQNSPWQSPSPSPKGSARPGASPCGSPRPPDEPSAGRPGSRPVSPCGAKRKYSFNGGGGGGGPARSPSPGPSPRSSPRLSFTEDSWPPSANSAILAAINALSTDGAADLGEAVAVKARRTGPERGGGGDERTPPDPCGEERPSDRDRPLMKKEAYFGGFLDVPQQRYSWPKPYVSPSLPSPPTPPSLPALDWQLPSASGPYSLQMEVQPKSHHRAHYETEGSRGAVKAPGGGHPVVQLRGYASGEPLTLQLFIGTADERLLRPHAFYQVHRITGKTVSTPSHEALRQPNTKVLEIPLLPANDMRATIDCAGILKLRNSDIELRKGETDIGRKNTRVRMVFRVHVGQPGGRTVSLQTASNPIECSQRSAQELPLVDKQSLESAAAAPGGQTLRLDGHNFQADSKVVFVEKAQDGHHLWETEARVDRDASKHNVLLVEIPPYRERRLSAPAPVNFYVCNGKRKRSQYRRFTYVPSTAPTVKTEPRDDYDAPPGHGLSEPHFPDDLAPAFPAPHVSIIRETPGRFRPPERPLTPGEARLRRRRDDDDDVDGSPGVGVGVSVKREPQELDQMYLDDVNEIIRNDLSSISGHA